MTASVAVRSRDEAPWQVFFAIAAIYDIALGIAFLFLWRPVFDFLGMAIPPQSFYVEMPAIFVGVQGISYALVVRRPFESVKLVEVGIVYKAAYTAITAWYLIVGGMPSVFFVIFGALDLLFMIGFIAFVMRARQERQGVAA